MERKIKTLEWVSFDGSYTPTIRRGYNSKKPSIYFILSFTIHELQDGEYDLFINTARYPNKFIERFDSLKKAKEKANEELREEVSKLFEDTTKNK